MTMNDMTASNLRSAFGGESQARTRYDIWGEQATKDSFPNVGRLFHCISHAEKIHATHHFNALKDEAGDFAVTSDVGFGKTTTSENLQRAIDGEVFEYTQMYPAYIAVAEMQGEKTALQAYKYAVEAEKVHAELFTEAKEAVDSGRDIELKNDKIYLCPVCGYVSLTGEEDPCPLCGCKKSIFVEY